MSKSFQIILSAFFAVFLSTTSLVNLQAQNPVADSLRNILETELVDTLKIKTLNHLSRVIRYDKPEEAITVCKSSIELANKINYPKGLAEAYYQLSYAYDAKNNGLDSAKIYIEKSIQIAEKIKDYSLLSGCYSHVAFLEQKLEDQTEAAFKAIEYADKSGDYKRKISALHNLGLIFHIADQVDDALKYYLQSEALAKEKNYLVELKGTYNNIAIIYSDREDFETALHYKREALKLIDKENYPILWARNASNLSAGFVDLEMYDSAKVYLDEAEQIFTKQESSYLKFLYESKGYFYYKQKDYKNALPYFEKTLQLLKTNTNNSSYIGICEAISKCYYELGQFKKSSLYKDTILTYYKDTYLTGLTEQLAEANVKYETEVKEKQINEQALKIEKQKNNSKTLAILALAIIGFMLLAFQYYFQKQKRKKQAAEHQLELKNAETKSLKKLDLLKTQFFTNVSHELRTPLTLISGPLENALAKNSDTTLQKDITTAHKQTKKLSNLVNELLDFSKLESGKLEIVKKNIQLTYFLKRVFFAFESLAELRKINLVEHIKIDEKTWISIDDNKLEKILNNLLSNALKFTPKNGTVTFFATIENSNLHFEVKDTGNGIDTNDLPHLFERFYQSEKNTEALLGGTGIGLALCKELTELMNGNISAKNNHDIGSCFIVNIPIEVTTNISTQPQVTANIEEEINPLYTPLFINGKKPKILIVEDNYEMSRYLNELLSEHYNCTTAFDGEEALKKVKQQNFDLISCDIMMPNMDGFTFKSTINTMEEYKNIPFIMLTARAIEEDKLKGLKLGVDDYIAKPFSKLELEARIHNLLQNKIEREAASLETGDENETKNIEISFLEEVEKIILDNISNTDFKVTDLAEKLNYSQRQLSRILKKSSGLSPVAFILEVRLQKARRLLEQRKYNSVKEVQFEIGIDSASYFTKKFKERFGKSPSSYLE